MFVMTDTVVALPFAVAFWVLEAWRVALAARLVLRSVRAAWAGRVRAALVTTAVAGGCWLPVLWPLVVDDVVEVFTSAALPIAPAAGFVGGIMVFRGVPA